MAFRRTSYITVLGLAYQSYRFELGMGRHLLEMANAARKAATFESEFQSNSALAVENSEKSVVDKLESESLHERAVVLEAESERDAAIAEASHASSVEFASKAAEEEARAEIRETAAAAEEAIYDADTEKALAEAAEAAELELETETDGLMVGTCEFIPGMNFFCDLVGGIAALRMEASAAKWTVKSALDITAAATAKEQENANLVASATLHAQAGEDSETASEVENEAAEEQARSEEEAAGAKKEELEANVKSTESKEENFLSEEENLEADIEQEKSGRWLGKSLIHGLAAFWDAILAGLVSLMAFLFFIVRACVTVIVPSVTELTKYLPLSMILPGQESNGFIVNDRGILRQMSYFLIHCGVFFTGIITFFGKFEVMEKVDTRSQGGIIFMFALFVASVQSILLHVLPQYRSIQREASSLVSSCLYTMWRGSCIFFFVVVHLVPLIIMETLSLWLIFGHGIFSPSLSKNVVPFIICLLYSTLVYIYIFERGDGCAKNKASVDDECTIPYCNSISDSDSLADKNEILNNEGDSLLKVTAKHELVKSDLCVDGERCSVIGIDATNEIVELGVEALSRHNSFGYQSLLHGGNTKGNTPSGKMSSYHSNCNDNYATYTVEREKDLEQIYTGVDSEHDDKVVVTSDSKMTLEQVCSAAKQYFSVLQFPFEVLVTCCMFTFLKSSIPISKKLWPIFRKDFIGSHQPGFVTLTVVGASVSIVTFLWCLYGSSKKISSSLHVGLFTGESFRTTIRTFLSEE